MKALPWLLAGWLLFFVTHASAQSKEQLYTKGMQLYQQKRYKQAIPVLNQLLQVLKQEQQKQKPNTRVWHGMTLGQTDVLERLAHAMWSTGQKNQACRTRKELDQKVRSLPSGWQSWSSNPSLPKRLLTSQALLKTQCAVRKAKPRQRPLVVVVRRVPPRTTIVVVRQPPPRRREKKKPVPPPVPVYKTWWFWTVTGAVVVGAAAATTAAVILSNSQSTYTIQSGNPSQPLAIW